MTITVTVEELRAYHTRLSEWNNKQCAVALKYIWEHGEELYRNMPAINVEAPINAELREWTKTNPRPLLIPHRMTWYYHIRGSHVHIRVYMNGAFCGTLFLRYEEFTDVREWAADRPYLRFVEDKENKS